MSYVNGTTHYNLPQTVGTDKRDWTDTNQAFADIDSAIHTAVTTAETGATNIQALQADVNALDTRVTSAEADIATNTTDIGLINTKVNSIDADIADVRQDAEDMICAYNEATATSTHAYAVDDYFIYNDVLYKVTAPIAIGGTIVPNTNCKATNVTTELLSGGGSETVSASNVTYDGTTSGLSATDVQNAIDEVNSKITTSPEYVFEDVTGDASQIASGTTTDVNIDVTKAGYTPVAVIVKDIGNRTSNSWKYAIANNTVTLSVQSNASSIVTITPVVCVVYLKN